MPVEFAPGISQSDVGQNTNIEKPASNFGLPSGTTLLPGEPMPRQVIYTEANPQGVPGKEYVVWSNDVPIPVDPDMLATPEQRFQALLNILKNYGMVLTILAMDRKRVRGETTTPTFTFEYYTAIHKRTNALAGRTTKEPYARQTTTLSHLTHTLSPLAVAAREGADGKSWQLTHFGETIKPALIWAVRQFQEYDFNSMEILGSRSAKTKVAPETPEEDLVTPAQTRALILFTLAFDVFGKPVETHDLEKLCKISNTGLPVSHLEPLRRAGFITFETVEANKPVTFYSMTELGKNEETWPLTPRYRSISIKVLEALKALTHGNQTKEVSYEDIKAYFKSQNWKYPGRHISPVLTFFKNIGCLKTGTLSNSHQSDIRITDKGRAAAQILGQLYLFAIEPRSVPEILKTDISPSVNQALFGQIIDRFRKESPFVDKEPMDRLLKVYSYFASNNNQTSAQAHRALGFKVNQFAAALKSAGVIMEGQKDGRTIPLSVSTHPNGSPLSVEEIAERLAHALINYQKTKREAREETERPRRTDLPNPNPYRVKP